MQHELPPLVLVIDDLGAGGAERMLVGLLQELALHYKVILVTLNEKSDFEEKQLVYHHRYIIGFSGFRTIVKSVKKLRGIIKKHQPVIVASHLYWSTIISRMAIVNQIPLVFTVHQMLSDGAFNFNKKGILLKWLDRLTYKRSHVLVGVSEEVIKDYEHEVGLKGKYYVLHNYISDKYFQKSKQTVSHRPTRFVAVGNPKWEKNFEGLIRAMAKVKDLGVSCDIYGYSGYNTGLQQLIDSLNAPVVLKGRSEEIAELLQEYDVFIMSSFSEGFGIVAAEAMAVGLPVMLSDLKVLHEVTNDNAIFFNPKDENDLAAKLRDVVNGKYDLQSLVFEGKRIAKENYTKQAYLEKLLLIYKDVRNESFKAN